MADAKDAAAEKPENAKAGRRTSFVRALNVPNIARRVKQFEQAVQGDYTNPPIPSRQRAVAVDAPESITEPAPDPFLPAHNTERRDEDIGGAEIPDIPLRRSSNTINSDVTASSLGALERMLAAGPMQDGQHPGPLTFHPFQLQPEKRYDAQYHVPDARSLYPLTERSWESSLPDGSEVSEEPSLERETSSSPDLQQRGTLSRDAQQRLRPLLTELPPRPDMSAPVERSDDGPTSPLDLCPASPYDRERAPSRMAESRSISTTTGTSLQTFQTEDQSSAALPALQSSGADSMDAIRPVNGDELDPESFDLVVPASNAGLYSLEHRSELLFSVEHMRIIIMDPIFLHRFSNFIGAYRPQSVPLLDYTLEALKAMRAVEYANDIISRSLRFDSNHQLQHHPPEFAAKPAPELTVNESLKYKTAAAFEALAKDDLPAYITHTWTDIVEVSMRRKIMGMMPKNLQYMSEGLAEVFCITDPSRKDSPIVFASEEFHRTTGYGPDYVLGRNCRFLQGPRTNPSSTQRIREKLAHGKEHYETFLNYRRDGLPFMNLLMCTPLLDSKGQVRYFLGAQIDVSGLVKDCSGLESLRKLVDQDEEEQRRCEQDARSSATVSRRDSGTDLADGAQASPTGAALDMTTPNFSSAKDPTRAPASDNELRLLSEMFNRNELETVRRFGGRMHRPQELEQPSQQQVEPPTSAWHKPRVVLQDPDEPSPPASPIRGFVGGDGRRDVSDANGNINISMPTSRRFGSHGGVSMPASLGSSSNSSSSSSSNRPPAAFENYLVVRPFPSLKILFASPSLRVPGMLQSPLMSRIGGSWRIHEELEHAFAMGQSVTAKIKWISGGLRNVASAGTIPDSSSGASSSGSGTVISAGAMSGGGGGGVEGAGQDGRPRWIHCTPLLGANGSVGVWVVVIVDEYGETGERKRARRAVARQMAPPVAPPARTWRPDMASRSEQSTEGGEALSPADYTMSEDEPRWRDTGRAWEKGWADIRDEGLRGGMRLRNEDSYRSEATVRESEADHGMASAFPGGGTGQPKTSNNEAASAGNGDGGTKPRDLRKETISMSSIDRALGTISSARSHLLSKPSARSDALRQEKDKAEQQQQQQQQQKVARNSYKPDKEPASVTAARLKYA
ncbi:unnamed protein product [Discula destructiva]